MATFKGKKMTTGTAADLQQMSKAAERDGVALTINSAFRDPNYQAKLFKQAVAKYGSVAAARKWVAPPGRSQHQTGKAVDISMGKGSGRVHEWLRQNAAKFGFTQSYSWEPWHWFHRASRSARQTSRSPAVWRGSDYRTIPWPWVATRSLYRLLIIIRHGLAGPQRSGNSSSGTNPTRS